GVARSFYSGNNDALLHDTLKEAGQEDKFHYYLGKTGSMFQIALACSGVLGGVIAYYSFPAVLWLSVVAQIICLILSFFFIDPPKLAEETTNIYSHLSEAFKNFKSNE